jgi:hypothetical protein
MERPDSNELERERKVAEQWRGVLCNKFPDIEIVPRKSDNRWSLRVQTSQNASPDEIYRYCQRHSKLINREGVAVRDIYLGDKLALDQQSLQAWADA